MISFRIPCRSSAPSPPGRPASFSWRRRSSRRISRIALVSATAPLPVLAVAIGAGAASWLALRKRATLDRAALTASASIVLGSFGWLMWRARPDFLPAGTGRISPTISR